MKIAFVYDWLTTPYGGAEQVLLALHEIFPQAPLYTSVYNPQLASWASVFEVRTSWLQKIPGAAKHHRWLGLFLPLAFESFDFDEFDTIISITSFAAKGILTKPNQLHLCYLLTPPRYLYSHQDEYVGKWQQMPMVGWLIRLVLKYLKWWDQTAASRPDQIIPISDLVAQRVKTYYRRTTAPVIYPPVSINKNIVTNQQDQPKNPYYLIISRLVAYKKIDLAIQACQQLNRQLVIVGDGPEKTNLNKLASSTTHFLGTQSNAQLQNLYNDCTALLMPGEEDFGITGLEALAYGKPVVVYHQSGVAELIQNQVHGIHLKESTVPALMQAIQQLESTRFSTTQLMNYARQFSTAHFQHQFQAFIKQQAK